MFARDWRDGNANFRASSVVRHARLDQAHHLISCVSFSFQVRRSLKIRGRRKEKEKLPSGITADYSAEFFAHLDIDRGVERDRGVEEVLADGNHTIDNNGDGEHPYGANISHSDSSETSLHSIGANKVNISHTHTSNALIKIDLTTLQATRFLAFFRYSSVFPRNQNLKFFRLFGHTRRVGQSP